jgi:hypothetical protein
MGKHILTLTPETITSYLQVNMALSNTSMDSHADHIQGVLRLQRSICVLDDIYQTRSPVTIQTHLRAGEKDVPNGRGTDRLHIPLGLHLLIHGLVPVLPYSRLLEPLQPDGHLLRVRSHRARAIRRNIREPYCYQHAARCKPIGGADTATLEGGNKFFGAGKIGCYVIYGERVSIPQRTTYSPKIPNSDQTILQCYRTSNRTLSDYGTISSGDISHARSYSKQFSTRYH